MAWVFASASRGLPPQRQVVQVPGGGLVNIERDEHGVPKLTADKDEDIYFAMGYVHAQDRLWQMEMQRRFAAGRLSEIFGKTLLDHDSWIRTLGLRRSAESAYASLSAQAQRSLTAYAAGVNAWLCEEHALPFEFTLLAVRPEPWTELDSLSWSKVFALNLAGNSNQELGKVVAARYLSAQQLHFFFPGNDDLIATDEGQIASGSLASLVTFLETLRRDWQIGGREVGSNAWVIAGRHTLDGSALLANDPHLGLQLPSTWYPVVQHGKNLRAQGMSLVGLPPVIFGQNGKIAWGGTSMMADVQDFMVERLDPADANRYLADGAWMPFERRTETIEVARDFPSLLHQAFKPVRIEVRETRNGPIVSSSLAQKVDQPMSLRWTALQRGDRSYESWYAVSYSNNWATFRASFRNFVAPALNMLYADRDGNIGYVGVGAIPIRLKGDGSAPVPGWDRQYGWQGQIPPDAMPSLYNPPEGYIVSANNRPVDDSYPYFISNNWASSARAERIRDLITQSVSAGRKLTLADMRTIQIDERSLSARHLVPVLTAIKPNNEAESKALVSLKGWQGDMVASSSQAALFNVWMRHLSEVLFSDALNEDWIHREQQQFVRTVLSQPTIEQIERALTDTTSTWCNRRAVESADRSCERLLRESLGRALAELTRRLGNDQAHWRWGDLHQVLYAHQPFSGVRGLSKLFERRIQNVGGGPDSINVTGFSVDETEGYIGHFGATSRQIIAIGHHRVAHQYMNSTGQSGNWMSPHYDDMVKSFTVGDYYSLNAGGLK
nr:penicillin acylase family protein [Pelomonas sp. P7]